MRLPAAELTISEGHMEQTSYFSMVSPESLGIDSEGIRKFIQWSEYKGLELHRMMILRRGKCCAKVNWLPYTASDMHPLYSFSKSLTATAVGFARQEGLLSLDEKLIDIFPEDCPEEISDHLATCTIHHLLCMSCGQETEIRDHSAYWRKTFFAHPFLHEPGTFYKYNTAGTNILAAVIRKKTGLQVTEYLRPRLLDPLGIKDIYCAQYDDDLHTEYGGGGMKLKLEDMAKFTQFMLQDGVWEGKHLLDDWYFARAGVKQMETAGDSEGHVYDWAYGYGYQCWMGSLPQSFRADGAFGQFGLVYPTLDLCIIINAATEQTQTIMDLVAAHILSAVHEDTADCQAVQTEEQKPIIEERELPALSGSRNPVFEQQLNAAVYTPSHEGETMCGLQTLVGGAGLLSIEKHAIDRIRFQFIEDRLILFLTEDGREKLLEAGLERSFFYTEIDGLTYAASARWRSLRRLELEIRRTDAMSGVRLILNFEGNRLNFEADETLMTDGGLGMTQRNFCSFIQVQGTKTRAIEKTGNNPGGVRHH